MFIHDNNDCIIALFPEPEFEPHIQHPDWNHVTMCSTGYCRRCQQQCFDEFMMVSRKFPGNYCRVLREGKEYSIETADLPV